MTDHEDAHVLVVDDDMDVRNVVEMTLRLAGFEVTTAVDGSRGIEAAIQELPDVIVLDVMMPDLDGYEVTRRLRADARVSDIPILMLTAKAQIGDKIVGLDGGADDYITKPFESDELVARVQAVLRRSRQRGSVSPLTGLPGNVRIEQELQRRMDADQPFAILYADMNQFKSLNDRYGWLHGDRAIRTLADVFRRQIVEHADEHTFLGHIGGDDFVMVTSPELAEKLARESALAFDRVVPSLYSEEDLERGWIEVQDRQGNLQRYPPITVSIGVAISTTRKITTHRELVEVATEMKNYAKRAASKGSNYSVDRRRDD